MTKYPIFTITANWLQDLPDNYESVNFDRDTWNCPQGRLRDESGRDYMFKSWPGQDELDKQEQLSRVQAIKRYADKNISCVSVGSKFLEMETWCSAWFSHWTWDTGESDSDVLSSFASFVDRKMSHNREVVGLVSKGWKPTEYCLMGAEDSWRWCSQPSGKSVIGTSDERLPAPCRCDGCKKKGVVSIDH